MVTPNMISKEEIIKLLKSNINKKEIKKYTISSLLQYNVDIETEEFAENYLNEEYIVDDLKFLPFLNIIKEIRNIYWKPCLPIFKEVNELFIIYYENIEIKNNNITKRMELMQQEYDDEFYDFYEYDDDDDEYDKEEKRMNSRIDRFLCSRRFDRYDR